MILTMIILGSLGWILVGFLLFKALSEEKNKDSKKAIHLSALRDGRVAGLFKCGLIEGIPVVRQEDLDLISKELESEKIPDNNKENLQAIKELPIQIEDGEFVAICKRLNCSAVIAGDFRDKLELQGINCINIKDIDKIGKGDIFKGQKIRINSVEYGYNMARGLLNDGTIVEVRGDLPKDKPLSFECRVQSVLEGSLARKIWARWEND